MFQMFVENAILLRTHQDSPMIATPIIEYWIMTHKSSQIGWNIYKEHMFVEKAILLQTHQELKSKKLSFTIFWWIAIVDQQFSAKHFFFTLIIESWIYLNNCYHDKQILPN